MNELCVCEADGFCLRHKAQKSVREHQLCKGIAETADSGLKYWNAWEQGKLGATASEEPQLNPPGFAIRPELLNQTMPCQEQPRHVQVSKIGDRLMAIFETETGASVPCGECKAQIRQLNNMTVEEVRAKRAEIINKIADRAKKVAPKLWQRIAVTVDRALHFGETERRIGKWLDRAVEEEEAEVLKNHREKRTQEKKGKRSTKHIEKRWDHKHAAKAPRDGFGQVIREVQFIEPVRRNLLYHIYPIKNNREMWQWNLDQLIRRIDLFNGKRIVGIVHDKLSDHPDMVKEYLLGHVDNFVVLKNDKRRGEGVTFGPMMEQIESFEKNEVTFRAHAKGVSKKGSSQLPVIRRWTEIMYSVCLDDWNHVRLQLEKCGITGPFRSARHLLGFSYFSGSFYWFRNRDTFSRSWREISKHRAGIESWPFELFQKEQTGCLFCDEASSMYQANYMKKHVWPEYQKWLQDSIHRDGRPGTTNSSI